MEKDCQYLSWENAPIGPLLGHAAHLARERMDVRLARYDVTPVWTDAPAGRCRASAGQAADGQRYS